MSSKPFTRLLLAVVLFGGASFSSAAGLYNMPTNLRQCFGVGFGPGYHAPLLLGNPYRAGNEAKPIKWLPHGLAPPANHGFAAAPTSWGGCESGQCGQPTMGWESYTHQAPSYHYGQTMPYAEASGGPPPTWSTAPATPSPNGPSLQASGGEVIPTPQPSR